MRISKLYKYKQIQTEYFSEEQKLQIAKNHKFYNDYTNDNLKELLSKNRQIKTGTRDDLLNRCAEMKLLGGLRFCPKCKKGNLKFNNLNGDYFCEGNSKDCKYYSSTAERNAWIDL